MKNMEKPGRVNEFIKRLRGAVGNGLLYLGNYSLLKFVSPRPNYAEIRVTEGCNSRCLTCSAWKNSRVGELTTREMSDALQQLKRIGIESVRLSGGEPLLRPDITALVKECSLLGFKEIYVATNGLLLQQKAEELIRNGVTHFGVSLDGLKDTNDRIRGVCGHYDKVLKGIETVKNLTKKMGQNIPVTVFTTLLRQNIHEIPSILQICQKVGARWCFSLLDGNIDLFEGIDVSKFAVTDWEIIDKTIDYLKEMWYEKPWFIYSRPDILDYARNYLKGMDLLEVPCMLGYKLICLGSSGEVYPGCYVFKPVGNLREMGLVEIVKLKEYRRLAERMYRRECPGCTFFYEDNIILRNLFKKGEMIRKIFGSR